MKILKRTKLIFLTLRIGVNNFTPILTFFAIFWLLSTGRTTYEIIFVSLPWSLFNALNGYYTLCAIFYQMAYFHIICYYLYLKLKRINKQLKERIKSKKSKGSIVDILKKIDASYLEINAYNNQFWSKFIVLVYIMFNIILSTLLYSICFGSMDLIIMLIDICMSIILLLIFLVFLFSATLIDNQVKTTYKLLNLYFLSFEQKIGSNRIKASNL